MDNKGFTLVEILSVIVLLSIVITLTVTISNDVGKNAKIKLLNSKIENIEKAAVLYGQENDDFTTPCDIETKPCYNKVNCYCYNNSVTVQTLVDNKLIQYDAGNNVVNPVNESKNINECNIQLYKKYGKIYAIYDKANVGNSQCGEN
ncbi:MAG: prepilin-type N-terminal cleavage/methylation domain-containing protein [Bacilli bacterium]|nr:prepilin-type N-terminal cleavage/methylation domain-containing protein [Bacilli bacterium]